MMQAIKQSRSATPYWKYLAVTESKSTTFGFDRFRIYGDTSNLKIAIFRNNTAFEPTTGKLLDGEFISEQPFHSGGGWTASGFEHDFTFDLSAETGDIVIAIKNYNPTVHLCSQVYAFPSGFSATRGKNSQIYRWNFHTINPNPNADGTGNSIIRFNGGTLNNFNAPSQITTTKNYLTNCVFTSSEIDEFIIKLDANGQSNGVLEYNNSFQNPTVASRSAYDSLITKGWTITGTPPPA